MLEASIETVHNRNLYVYCDNNPIVRVDGIRPGHRGLFPMEEAYVKRVIITAAFREQSSAVRSILFWKKGKILLEA